jgi:glucans biosynthesis protein C
MQSNDRLHALDAVRAGALLLGVVLHAAASFLEGFPIPIWNDTPNATPTVMYYVIHMFRMSAFFLIAGFFARLVLERRGVNAFAKDRAKRIAVPLFLFGPVISIVFMPVCVMLGALTHGVDNLKALQQQFQNGGGAPQGMDLGHLWFLYYLLMYYVLALTVRWLSSLSKASSITNMTDRVIAFIMRGVWAPVLVAAPLAVYFLLLKDWNEWIGLPSPFSLVPALTGLVSYGVPFTLGWLLHRQIPLLLGLQSKWMVYLLAAIALTVTCISIVGITPIWSGTSLHGTERWIYGFAYMIGLWCWVFALIGAALRFLNHVNPTIRYLADASYWIYLMHLGLVAFFIMWLRPFDLHWSIKLIVTVGGSITLLLLSYRYLVRSTWIGAILNGRRYLRTGQALQPESDAKVMDSVSQ